MLNVSTSMSTLLHAFALAVMLAGTAVAGSRNPNKKGAAALDPDMTPQHARPVFQRQWNNYRYHMEQVRVGQRPLLEALGPVMQHEYELPLVQLQKSLVYLGPNNRLRRVVHDLMNGGMHTKIGAIGGSITEGAVASKLGETDWFSLVGTYLRAAFPHANMTIRNGALSATPSALMNMCLEVYLNKDVDLVFVEYVANDGTDRLDTVQPRVYERLLRKVLQLPKRPAVVLVQLMPKGLAFQAGLRDKGWFMDTLEDAYGAQAQYYDLPWVSFRNAMWRLGELHRYGYTWSDVLWDGDYMHPIDPGMRVISDIVINLLQTTARSLLEHPFGPLDIEMVNEPLPEPMHHDNWEARNVLCEYGQAFAKRVDQGVSKGWEFINEGKDGKKKWGFISTTPGSQLRVRVDARRVSGDGKKQMNVMLAYLKSYDHMGRARFECLSGCTCEPLPEVDAHHSLPTSTVYLARLLVSESPECVIGVTLLDGTSSGEHKFKLSGIMMNEYLGPDVTSALNDERWLSSLQATAGR